MFTKRVLLAALLVPAFSLALVASDDDADTFRARLRGLNEVPPVATAATGPTVWKILRGSPAKGIQDTATLPHRFVRRGTK